MTGLVASKVLFYLFGLFTLYFAFRAVTTTRILRAAVSLMLVLLGTAAFYALLGANFLAGIQVLVYVGGIVVMLVFAIMLTHTNELLEPHPSPIRVICALAGSGLFAAVTSFVFTTQKFNASSAPAIKASEAAELGRSFLNYGQGGYALPFEIISLLLLAAVIGGIVIARKVSRTEEAAQ